MTQHSATQRQSHRGGMSLVELTIAMLISCIILAGMSAPLYLALESNNAAVTPDAAALESARVLADISGELQYALAVTKQKSAECEFTVPDRDGNLVPETVKIKWKGKAGDPVTRKLNSGDDEVLVDNVYDFGFSYYAPDATLEYVQCWIQVGDNSRAGMETITRMWNEP
ncbi:MAG: prepilin-type N-terminal cleavage/methylation domain-containing protein [Planctomycetales bacterium]|nr:prepilin-type N-terminal cleavage/methylation domain-containing protein [Planctomycetales bacterium]